MPDTVETPPSIPFHSFAYEMGNVGYRYREGEVQRVISVLHDFRAQTQGQSITAIMSMEFDRDKTLNLIQSRWSPSAYITHLQDASSKEREGFKKLTDDLPAHGAAAEIFNEAGFVYLPFRKVYMPDDYTIMGRKLPFPSLVNMGDSPVSETAFAVKGSFPLRELTFKERFIPAAINAGKAIAYGVPGAAAFFAGLMVVPYMMTSTAIQTGVVCVAGVSSLIAGSWAMLKATLAGVRAYQSARDNMLAMALPSQQESWPINEPQVQYTWGGVRALFNQANTRNLGRIRLDHTKKQVISMAFRPNP